MKNPAAYCCLLAMLATAGCNSDSTTTETRTFYVNHHKAECGAAALVMCLQTKVNLDDNWLNFFDVIQGFDYEWGYTYKIEVKVETVENPPADASSLKYTLLSVLEKQQEPATTLFDVSASRATGLITKVSDGLYRIYDDKDFSCTPTQCATVDTLIVQDLGVLLEVSHNPDPAQPLVLSQVKCSAARASFNDSCL